MNERPELQKFESFQFSLELHELARSPTINKISANHGHNELMSCLAGEIESVISSSSHDNLDTAFPGPFNNPDKMRQCWHGSDANAC